MSKKGACNYKLNVVLKRKNGGGGGGAGGGGGPQKKVRPKLEDQKQNPNEITVGNLKHE